MSTTDRIHFKVMSLIHETLYGLCRDPYKVLNAAGLKPGQSVLEVGCGPGFFTIPAARIVGERGQVHTLDINPLALESVHRKVKAAGLTNVTASLADAVHTGLPGGSFDLAFLFGFIHPIGNLDDILAELCRLLKPAGILAVEGKITPPNSLFRLEQRQGRIAQFSKVSG